MTLKLAASACSRLANEIVFSPSSSFCLIVFWSFFPPQFFYFTNTLLSHYFPVDLVSPCFIPSYIYLSSTVSEGGGEDRAPVVLRGCHGKIFKREPRLAAFGNVSCHEFLFFPYPHIQTHSAYADCYSSIGNWKYQNLC